MNAAGPGVAAATGGRACKLPYALLPLPPPTDILHLLPPTDAHLAWPFMKPQPPQPAPAPRREAVAVPASSSTEIRRHRSFLLFFLKKCNSYYKQRKKETGGYHPTTLTSERNEIRKAAKKFALKGKNCGMKRKVLEKFYETHSGTHHGISRALTSVESQYYWPSITSVKQWVWTQFQRKKEVAVNHNFYFQRKLMGPIWDLETFLKRKGISQHCQITKTTAVVAFKFHIIKAKNQSVAVMDLMGPSDTTSKNMYAILLIDVFSKKAVVLLLHDLSAAEMAAEMTKAIMKTLLCYGPLQKIAVDQGEELIHQISFISQMINDLKKYAWKQLACLHYSSDGCFHSEVGPCIKDYIANNGCAILRDAAGSRLKPIKISHIKPYIKGTHNQNSSYVWRSAIVVDHDYVGSSETSTEQSRAEQSRAEVFCAKGPPSPAHGESLLRKDLFSECKSTIQLEFTDPNCTESVTLNPKQWSADYRSY
ncbi:LOW QUALITY PROTEIN: gypsy retrotransposon integrase-like protein 1 [Liasis olivaceus]